MDIYTILSKAAFSSTTHYEAIADFSGICGATILLSGVVYFTGGASGGRLSYANYNSYISKFKVLVARNTLYSLTYNFVSNSYKHIVNVNDGQDFPLYTIMNLKTNLQFFGKFAGLDIAEALSIDSHTFNWNSRSALISYAFKTSLEIGGTIIGITLGTVNDKIMSDSLDTTELWNNIYSIPKIFGSNYVIDIVTRLPALPALNILFNRLSNTAVFNVMYNLIRPVFNVQYINFIINNVNLNPSKEIISSYIAVILDKFDIEEALEEMKVYIIHLESINKNISSESKKIIDSNSTTEKLKKFDAFIDKVIVGLSSLNTSANLEYFLKQLDYYEQEIKSFKEKIIYFIKTPEIIKKFNVLESILATKQQECEHAILLNKAKSIFARLLIDTKDNTIEKFKKIKKLKKTLVVQDLNADEWRVSGEVIKAASSLELNMGEITSDFVNEFLQRLVDEEYSRLKSIKEQAKQLVTNSNLLPETSDKELEEFYSSCIQEKQTTDNIRNGIKSATSGIDALKEAVTSNVPYFKPEIVYTDSPQQSDQQNNEELIQKIQNAKNIEELLTIVAVLEEKEQHYTVSAAIKNRVINYLITSEGGKFYSNLARNIKILLDKKLLLEIDKQAVLLKNRELLPNKTGRGRC